MVVIFDLDETLICNTYNPKTSLETFSLSDENFSEHFILRPYARKVLSELRDTCDGLHMATFSPRGRVERILKTIGIRKYFDKMFTRENFDPVYGGGEDLRFFDPGDFIAVDDQEADSQFMAMKMSFFGACDRIDRHLIVVPQFDGSDTDRCLLTVLDEIKIRRGPAGRVG
jgi:beta-phosphoglucomutase-like phosphatase (HAD superfamily)